MPQTKQQVLDLIQKEMDSIDDSMGKREQQVPQTYFIDNEWNKLLFTKQLLLNLFLKANR